jgi:hypothetical protein
MDMVCAAGPPKVPPRSWRPSGKIPGTSRRALVIIGALLAAAVIGVVLAVSFQQAGRTGEPAPRVTFVRFEVERQEIRAGQNTSILFNVENSGDMVVEDAMVVVAIEPEVGNRYLSTSNSTMDLPVLYSNARSGDMTVTITATGAPAREAVYDVKGILLVQGAMADVKEFELTVLQ